MTRTTPRRVITLHFTQIFFTDARTFITAPISFQLSAVSFQFHSRRASRVGLSAIAKAES